MTFVQHVILKQQASFTAMTHMLVCAAHVVLTHTSSVPDKVGGINPEEPGRSTDTGPTYLGQGRHEVSRVVRCARFLLAPAV